MVYGIGGACGSRINGGGGSSAAESGAESGERVEVGAVVGVAAGAVVREPRGAVGGEVKAVDGGGGGRCGLATSVGPIQIPVPPCWIHTGVMVAEGVVDDTADLSI